MAIFRFIYNILWGDLISIPLPGGSTLGVSLLVLILIPAGLYFTFKTRFLPFRMFPEIDCLVEMSGETFVGERGIKFILCAGTAVIDIDHILSGIVERRGEIKRRT